MITADGKDRFHPRRTAVTPFLCMNPGVTVPAERDQVCRMIVRRVLITVVDMEVVGQSADRAPVSVTFSYRVPGRSPAPEAVLGSCADGLPEPDAEEGVFTPFRERAGVAERPEPVGVRPVPAGRTCGPVERRERELDFRIHTTPERRTGLEGFEPPTSGLEARRSILAKPQALATHSMRVSPILTIGTGRLIFPVPGKKIKSIRVRGSRLTSPLRRIPDVSGSPG
jgi:hypothetical protein